MKTANAQIHNLKISERTMNNLDVQNSPAEAAQYIADMLLELRNIAKAAGLRSLQGLLELGYYEAFSVAHRAPVPEGEADRLEQMGADARKAEEG